MIASDLSASKECFGAIQTPDRAGPLRGLLITQLLKRSGFYDPGNLLVCPRDSCKSQYALKLRSRLCD